MDTLEIKDEDLVKQLFEMMDYLNEPCVECCIKRSFHYTKLYFENKEKNSKKIN